MRCLAKNRDDRFATYASLTRELQSFGSTATTPATLGLRFLAGVIDSLALSIAMLPLHSHGFLEPLTLHAELTILSVLGPSAVFFAT